MRVGAFVAPAWLCCAAILVAHVTVPAYAKRRKTIPRPPPPPKPPMPPKPPRPPPPSPLPNGAARPPRDTALAPDVADPATELSGQSSQQCRSVDALAAAYQRLKGEGPTSVESALEAWCGTSAKSIGQWQSCPICVDGCLGARAQARGEELGELFLHWMVKEKARAAVGLAAIMMAKRGVGGGSTIVLHLGGPEADEDASDACVDWTVIGRTAVLDALGSLGKNLHGVCTQLSMKSVAHFHVAVLHALGVETLRADDLSYFGCPSVFTMPLKVATRGRTVYQDYYRDAFRFDMTEQRDDADCTAIIEGTRAYAVEHGLDKEADNVLSLTKDPSNTCEELSTAFGEFRGKLAPAMPVSTERTLCISFFVDVARAPVCASER